MSKRILFFFSLLFISIYTSTAQGWDYIYPEPGIVSTGTHVIPTTDGNYLGGGFQSGQTSQEFGSFATKFDEQGDFLWTVKLPNNPGGLEGLVELNNNQYLVYTTNLNNSLGQLPYLRLLDNNGTVIWDKELITEENNVSSFSKAIHQGNGNFIYATKEGDYHRWWQIDAASNIINSDTLNFPGKLYQQLPSGNLLWTREDSTGITLYESDSNANLISTSSITWTDNISTFGILNGEAFIVSSYQNGNDLTYIQYRFDNTQTQIDADTIWQGAFVGFRSMQFDSGEVILSGFTGNTPDPTNGTGIVFKTQLNGTVDFVHTFNHQAGPSSIAMTIPSTNDGYIGAGFFENISKAYFFKLDQNGLLFDNMIDGLVVIDDLPDCVAIAGETPIEGWTVMASKNGGPDFLIDITDADGRYQATVDTGNYEVTLYPPNDLWTVCTNDVVVDLTSAGQSATVDFAVNNSETCPSMTVSATTIRGEPCLDQPIYVSYCNEGTGIAQDAYIEIQLDSGYTAQSSTLTWTSISPDNLVTFDLGDVDPLECGDFTLTVNLACDARSTYAYYVEAHIYPDTICGSQNPQYTGPFLESFGACLPANVEFEIVNTGQSATDGPLEFFIVEDAVLMRADSIPVLDSGQSFQIQSPGNNSTKFLIFDQAPQAPGLSMPIEIVQGCATDGNISTGYTNQFQLDDLDIFIDRDYTPTIDAGMNQTALTYAPAGYGLQNYITHNTNIEYAITFQNNSTETVQNVTIRDTLSANFDLSTFKPLSSSHPYTLLIEDGNIAVFEFQNIQLASSMTDRTASIGLIGFSIQPKADLALGTSIENQATIIYDALNITNTNKSTHTIGDDFIEVIVVSTQHPKIKDVAVSVFPNPTTTTATFSIENHNGNNYQLSIYDLKGRLIHTKQSNDPQITIHKADLGVGFYFYELTSPDGLKSTGKIIMK